MIDKHSETWREVLAWATAERGKASERLESCGLPGAETELLRGRIATLRELTALADGPPPRIVEKTEGYGFQGPADN